MDFGNPGKEYEKTRHNVGFRAIDKLAEMLKINMSKNKFDAIIGEGHINGEKIMLVKPQTYMNLSGSSISQILDFYKLEPQDIVVIYDDIDIQIGKIRIRKSGSSGTHNGMRNIISMIASEDFPRVRIGTDKPKAQMNLADYVLTPFLKEEEELINIGISSAAEAVLKIITEGINPAMNEFNGIKGGKS